MRSVNVVLISTYELGFSRKGREPFEKGQLELVQAPWDQASMELLVGILRSARNPQRERQCVDAAPTGSANLRTGKPSLQAGYTSSTINHSLSVLSTCYAFRRRLGRGPLLNLVPASPELRRLMAHRSPTRAATPDQTGTPAATIADQSPRSLPDPLWAELFLAMGTDRARALLSVYVSPAGLAPASCLIYRPSTLDSRKCCI